MVRRAHKETVFIYEGVEYTPKEWISKQPGVPRVTSFLKKWLDNSTDFMLVHTSGSTGIPKPVAHRKDQMVASAEATIQFFNLQPGTRALLCLPSDKIGGMMMMVRALIGGWKLHIDTPSSAPLRNIEQPIDFAAMVPLQVSQSLNDEYEKWKYVKYLIVGGGVLQASLENRLKELDTEAWQTFGMTETVSHVAVRKIGEDKHYRALPDISFSLHASGQLVIHAPNLGKAQLQTNDLAELLDDTSFIWLGRADHAIESGGIKHIPEQLEQKIAPVLKRAFYIGSKPDKKLNNKLVLYIEGEPYDTKDLKKEMSDRMDKYEIPKEIEFVPRFKRTSNGKLKRF